MKSISSQVTLHVVGFAEITSKALRRVRDDAFPNYDIHGLGEMLGKGVNIGVIYDRSKGFKNEDFLAITNSTKNTRYIFSLDLMHGRDCIRFFFCHLTARMGRQNSRWRIRAAEDVGWASYDFVHKRSAEGLGGHVLLVGDFNDEPFGRIESWLYASRDRAQARKRHNGADETVKRLRLYNCSWRLLGERFCHPLAAGQRDIAGTYYWSKSDSWHTFDQIIASGSLLNHQPPYLMEDSVRIVCDEASLPDEYLGTRARPVKFAWNNGDPKGLSDHLPICGSLLLEV